MEWPGHRVAVLVVSMCQGGLHPPGASCRNEQTRPSRETGRAARASDFALRHHLVVVPVPSVVPVQTTRMVVIVIAVAVVVPRDVVVVPGAMIVRSRGVPAPVPMPVMAVAVVPVPIVTVAVMAMAPAETEVPLRRLRRGWGKHHQSGRHHGSRQPPFCPRKCHDDPFRSE